MSNIEQLTAVLRAKQDELRSWGYTKEAEALDIVRPHVVGAVLESTWFETVTGAGEMAAAVPGSEVKTPVPARLLLPSLSISGLRRLRSKTQNCPECGNDGYYRDAAGDRHSMRCSNVNRVGA